MPVPVNPRRAITVDDGGAVTVQPKQTTTRKAPPPPKVIPMRSGSSAERGSAPRGAALSLTTMTGRAASPQTIANQLALSQAVGSIISPDRRTASRKAGALEVETVQGIRKAAQGRETIVSEFMYAQVGTDSEFNEVFEDVYALALSEFDSQLLALAEQQRLMAIVTGDAQASAIQLQAARDYLARLRGRIGELQRTLNISAYDIVQRQALLLERERIAVSAATNEEELRLREVNRRLARQQQRVINQALGGGAAQGEIALETVFGYEVTGTFGEPQLTRLASANLAIVDYLDRVTSGEGLQTFRQYWSHNPDGTRVQVQLGDQEKTGEQFFGYVEQPESSVSINDADLHTIYLGSQVDKATIVHEFGHQLDRWFKLSQGTPASGREGLTGYIGGLRPEGSRLYEETSRYNLNVDFVAQGMMGFAAKQFFRSEYFADLFMTAVLAGQDEQILSLDIDSIGDRSGLEEYQSRNTSFFADCQRQPNGSIYATIPLPIPTGTITVTCEYQTVGWEDESLQSAVDGIFRELF